MKDLKLFYLQGIQITLFLFKVMDYFVQKTILKGIRKIKKSKIKKIHIYGARPYTLTARLKVLTQRKKEGIYFITKNCPIIESP